MKGGGQGDEKISQAFKGMLAYGSNFAKRDRLPSGQYEIYLTDMNNGAALLQYEDYGIKPDIVLSPDKDWMAQLLELIQHQWPLTF